MNFRNTGVMVLVLVFLLCFGLGGLLRQAPVPTGSANKHDKNVLIADVESNNPYQQLSNPYLRLEQKVRDQERKDFLANLAKLSDAKRSNIENHQSISRGEENVLTGFKLTYYNNDGISHITRSGRPTIDGITLGVDPRYIPLGTWVEIELPNGTKFKRLAEDTGAVHGKILDVYSSLPRRQLLKKGSYHNVKVRILGKEFDFEI